MSTVVLKWLSTVALAVCLSCNSLKSYVATRWCCEQKLLTGIVPPNSPAVIFSRSSSMEGATLSGGAWLHTHKSVWRSLAVTARWTGVGQSNDGRLPAGQNALTPLGPSTLRIRMPASSTDSTVAGPRRRHSLKRVLSTEPSVADAVVPSMLDGQRTIFSRDTSN